MEKDTSESPKTLSPASEEKKPSNQHPEPKNSSSGFGNAPRPTRKGGSGWGGT